ncbi:MAG: ABC transporter permease [Burkholderiaceae bacterium]|nr:ABC transporter permease [Burkholderiaceae bacterium]
MLVAASALGLVAGDWQREVAISHAPPSLFGMADPAGPRTVRQSAAPWDPQMLPTPVDIVDPLAQALRELGVETDPVRLRQLADTVPSLTAIADPIADEVQAARAALSGGQGEADAERSTSLALGADKWGRDVAAKTLKGAQTSILVGLAAALVATLIGTVLGALAGWFGGVVDDLANWFYSVFTSVPTILLVLAIAAVLGQRSLANLVVILGLTTWTGVFRLVRAEYLKHKTREYVRAADAIGASVWRRIAVHVFPNISHVVLIQFSLLAVSCIKSEVILSFLGFGVPVDGVSWGSMLNEAQNDLLTGKWWQLASATVAMAVFVTALSLLADAIRDAPDPRLKRR